MNREHLDSPASPGLSWASIGWILGFGATMMTVRFGPAWVLTYHEVFFAEPAREFLQTGDWIAPRLAGVANYQKPPLVSWLIAGLMGITGSSHEALVRLPALFADLVTAWLVAAIAARAYGDRVGRIAGLVQLTTFYAIFQSRLAEADMPLCAAITACMWAFLRGVEPDNAGDSGRRVWPAIYFAGAVVTFLIKGPIGLGLVGLPCGVYAIWSRRRAAWRLLLDPLGWVVLVVGCLAWPLLAYWNDPAVIDDMLLHNLDRFSGTLEGGHEGPLYYLYIAPLIVLPWTPFVISGLRAVREDGARPAETWRLLACWFAVPMILISLSAWKHKHYAIPALPPASILAALGLLRLDGRLGARGRRIVVAAGLLLATAAALAILPGLGTSSGRGFGPPFAPVLGAMAAGLLALGFAYQRLGARGRLATVFGTTWLVVVAIESSVMPAHDRYRPQTEMARRLNAELPTDAKVDLVCPIDPQIMFYLDREFRAVREYPDYVATLRDAGEGVRYIIGPINLRTELESLGEVAILHEEVAPRSIAAMRLRIDPPRLARVAKQVEGRVWR